MPIRIDPPMPPGAMRRFGAAVISSRRSSTTSTTTQSSGGGLAGAGSPEGVTTADPGQTYLDTSNGFFYAKQSGTGNTGWLLLIS